MTFEIWDGKTTDEAGLVVTPERARHLVVAHLMLVGVLPLAFLGLLSDLPPIGMGFGMIAAATFFYIMVEEEHDPDEDQTAWSPDLRNRNFRRLVRQSGWTEEPLVRLRLIIPAALMAVVALAAVSQ